MKKLILTVNTIADRYIRENFQGLQDFFSNDGVVRTQFQFFAITVPLDLVSGNTPTSLSDFLFPHGLGYTPKDILVTSVIGSGGIWTSSSKLIWNYSSFDTTNLDLTLTGLTASTDKQTVTIRALVGNYQ